MRWGALLLAACLVGAVACDDNPTSPEVQPLSFTANLSAANEVSLPGPSESGATGTASITLVPTRDPGTNEITGGRFTMSFTVQGFPAGSFITLAHIHGPGAAGVNAPVLVDTGLTAATGIGLPIGSASFTSPAITAGPATVNGIMANPSNYYFNVHTTLNPGGAVRGQLVAR